MKTISQIILLPENANDSSEESIGIIRIENVKIIYEDETEELDNSKSFEYSFNENDNSFADMKQKVALDFGVSVDNVIFEN